MHITSTLIATIINLAAISYFNFDTTNYLTWLWLLFLDVGFLYIARSLWAFFNADF